MSFEMGAHVDMYVVGVGCVRVRVRGLRLFDAGAGTQHKTYDGTRYTRLLVSSQTGPGFGHVMFLVLFLV